MGMKILKGADTLGVISNVTNVKTKALLTGATGTVDLEKRNGTSIVTGIPITEFNATTDPGLYHFGVADNQSGIVLGDQVKVIVDLDGGDGLKMKMTGYAPVVEYEEGL